MLDAGVAVDAAPPDAAAVVAAPIDAAPPPVDASIDARKRRTNRGDNDNGTSSQGSGSAVDRGD